MEAASFKGFSLRWSKADILSGLQDELEKQFQNESFSAGGFVVRIDPLPVPDWQLICLQNAITLTLPLEFTFKKPEGLFSIEGSGSMLVQIRLSISFPNDILHYEVELPDYKWLKSPVLSMGSIDFPVEFLADIVMKRIKEKHLSSWVEAFRQKWDFDSLSSQLSSKYLTNISLGKRPGWYANLIIKRWVWVGLKDESTHIHCIFYLDYEMIISDTKQTVSFSPPTHISIPLSNLLEKSHNSIRFVCSYTGLEKLIRDYSQEIEIGGKTFVTENVTVKKEKHLEIKFLIRSPVEGSVSVSGEPFFMSDRQSIDVTGLNVDISAEKFLLQLTSPILEKLVRNRIEDMLPVTLSDKLESLIVALKKEFSKQQIVFYPKQVSVKNLVFDTRHCEAWLIFSECLVSPADQSWSLSTL